MKSILSSIRAFIKGCYDYQYEEFRNSKTGWFIMNIVICLCALLCSMILAISINTYQSIRKDTPEINARDRFMSEQGYYFNNKSNEYSLKLIIRDTNEDKK